MTALMRAAVEGHVDCVAELVRAGANLGDKDKVRACVRACVRVCVLGGREGGEGVYGGVGGAGVYGNIIAVGQSVGGGLMGGVG